MEDFLRTPVVPDYRGLPRYRDLNQLRTLVWEKSVFGASNPDQSSVTAPTGGYSATAPFITLRNVGNKVLIPLIARALINSGSTLNQINVSTLATGQFTSGTALAVYNRNQRGVGSSVVAYTNATLPAFTAGNQILRYTMTAIVTSNARTRLEMFPYPGFVVVQPGGQLDIYSNSASGSATSWFFDIQWAEL